MKVVLDAHCLVPSLLRDALLDLALEGHFQPVWSAEIMDELYRGCSRLGVSQLKLIALLTALNASFPKAVVAVESAGVGSQHLRDPDDAHVIALTIQSRSEALLTLNGRDFVGVFEGHQIEVLSPDLLLRRLIARDHKGVSESLAATFSRYANPPLTKLEYCAYFRRLGCPGWAETLGDII